MTIRYLSRKTVKQRLWKTLNFVVGVTTILNVSMVGALIRPGTANAAVSSVTITTSLNPIDPSTGGGAGDDKDGEPPTSGNADPSEYLLAAQIVVSGAPATNAVATLTRANGDAFADSAIDNDNPRTLGTLPVGSSWVYWSINKDQLVAKKDHTENFTVNLAYDGGPTSSPVTVSTFQNSASISQNDMDFVESFTTPSAGTIGSTFSLLTKYEQSSANALSEINVQTYFPGTVLRLTSVDSYYYNNSDPGTIGGGTVPGGASFTQLKNPRITSIPATSDNNDYWIFKYTFQIIGFGGGIIAPYIQTLGQGSTWKVDSGYGSFTAAPAKIFGFKFNDLNGNGVWNQGESPIQGVTINLTGTEAGSTSTNASGYYEFTNLSAGAYAVAEVVPNGYTNTTPVSVNVTLTPGEQEQANFGNRQLVCNLVITKTVDKQTALPGEQLTYTLSYTNTGDGNCTGGGVRIDDVTPPNTTYVNGSNTQQTASDTDGQGVDFGYDHDLFGSANAAGYNPATKLLSWDAETVSPGETGTITYKVTVDSLPVCTT
ncbi:MAG: DUF11 domain-containing protein, partial [Candidatus Kerfeldbacteria bacterium]|nr:DUF11 domain-containing protein [Candidatus Kerfeldbacteria bacterium]